jgi:hypothetical protein
MLVGIEPSFADPDLWTFQCPKCELAYKVLAEDPMKSNKAAGWLKSELRPPVKAASVGSNSPMDTARPAESRSIRPPSNG